MAGGYVGYKNILLSDGVIINENDMWVVGDIYPDSASYWNTVRYGAAHWDGHKWTQIKIPVQTITPNPYTFNLSPQGIIKINENEFWLVAGSVHVFDGAKVTKSYWIHNVFGIPNPIFNEGQTPQHIYQTSDKKVYIYGLNGALAYFNGSSCIKIETNTNLDIMDMHGDYNPQTKEYELLALASRSLQMEGNVLLKISGQTATQIPVTGIDDYSKYDIWFSQGSNYWITGFGAFYKKSLTESQWVEKVDYPNSWRITSGINGWNKNDFFLLQSEGHILHFNGSSWKDFKPEINPAGTSFAKIIIQGKNVLILGSENGRSRGIILRGKRTD